MYTAAGPGQFYTDSNGRQMLARTTRHTTGTGRAADYCKALRCKEACSVELQPSPSLAIIIR